MGGYIIDWHACDLFPKSWIDLVVVLRVGSETLYDRLKARFVNFIPSIYLPLMLPSHHVNSHYPLFTLGVNEERKHANGI